MSILRKIRRGINPFLSRFGYMIVDLRKDIPAGFLLPGHVASLLKQLDINCVIDVGANRGQYGSMLRRAGYGGRLVSFEPVSESFRFLSARAAGDCEWRVIRAALGSSAGTKDIKVYAASDLSSFLDTSAEASAALLDTECVRIESVSVTTLDQVLPEATACLDEPRLFLKLDTQGWDLEVMRGATSALRHVCAVQSEISVNALYREMPSYDEALGFYRRLGFRPTGFFPVAHHKQDGTALEFDAVMVRDGKLRPDHGVGDA